MCESHQQRATRLPDPPAPSDTALLLAACGCLPDFTRLLPVAAAPKSRPGTGAAPPPRVTHPWARTRRPSQLLARPRRRLANMGRQPQAGAQPPRGLHAAHLPAARPLPNAEPPSAASTAAPVHVNPCFDQAHFVQYRGSRRAPTIIFVKTSVSSCVVQKGCAAEAPAPRPRERPRPACARVPRSGLARRAGELPVDRKTTLAHLLCRGKAARRAAIARSSSCHFPPSAPRPPSNSPIVVGLFVSYFKYRSHP